MIKMMAGQSVVQTALLLFLTLTEAGASIYDPANAGEDATGYYRGSRRHLTCIFNTFVLLTLFNKFNARKLHDEFHIFKGFFHSAFAPFIMLLILVLQIIIIEVGTEVVMQTVPLTPYQWIMCVLVGAITFPVGFILRLIKTKDTALVSDEDFTRILAKQKADRAARVAGGGEKPDTVVPLIASNSVSSTPTSATTGRTESESNAASSTSASPTVVLVQPAQVA
jgi:magnesium-transporting ATPase (P-type)